MSINDDEVPLLVEDDSEDDSNIQEEGADIQDSDSEPDLEGSNDEDEEDFEESDSDGEIESQEDVEHVGKKQKMDISAAKVYFMILII